MIDMSSPTSGVALYPLLLLLIVISTVRLFRFFYLYIDIYVVD